MATLVGVVVVVVVTSPLRSAVHISSTNRRAARRLPPYWTVHPGDSYTLISKKTGLTIAQLEAFNPSADPQSLNPGQRINLWEHPPKPRAKPPGPEFWTVQPGQSFGWIAAKTGISIGTLEQLNPRLKPAALQPGERIRLRP